MPLTGSSENVNYVNDLIVTGFRAAVSRMGERRWNGLLFHRLLPGFQRRMTAEDQITRQLGNMSIGIQRIYRAYPGELEELVHAAICLGIGIAVQEELR